jgi:polysaccharide export outer membrane protein
MTLNSQLIRRGSLLALVACAFALGGCISAHINEASVREAVLHPPKGPEQELPAMPVEGSTDYRIGPLDLLSVEIFQLPDLTRDVRVSAAGEISLPLIGRVSAGDKTPAELETMIAAKLEEHFLEKPQATVFVKEYMSHRVTVEGAVINPGVYSLTGRTSLLQMIATAHGLSEVANPAACVIYRNVEGRRYAALFDIREIRAGRLVDPEVLGGDTVIVDFSGGRAALKDLLSTIPIFAVYRLIRP